jgi:hypothetical protein
MLREYRFGVAPSAVVIITFNLGCEIDLIRTVDHIAFVLFHILSHKEPPADSGEFPHGWEQPRAGGGSLCALRIYCCCLVRPSDDCEMARR